METQKLVLGPKFNPYGVFLMSPVPNWVMRSDKLGPYAKLLYGRLASFAGEDGETYPKQQTLAAELGCSLREVSRAMKELREHGLVNSERAPHNCKYDFHWSPWIQPEDIRDKQKAEDILAKSGQQLAFRSMDDPAHPKPEVIRQSGVSDTPTWRMYPLKEDQEEDQFKKPQGGPGGPQPKAFLGEEQGARTSTASRDLARADCEPVAVASDPEEDPAVVARREFTRRVATAKAEVEQQSTRALRQVQANQARRKANQKPWQAAREAAKAAERPKPRATLPEGAESRLRAVWEREAAEALPGHDLSPWVASDRRQLAQLIELRGSVENVEKLVIYAMRNWKAIGRRFFRGKGTPLPVLATLIRFQEAWSSEAFVWFENLAVMEEYEQWKKDNPDRLRWISSDLRERYQKAKKNMESLDL